MFDHDASKMTSQLGFTRYFFYDPCAIKLLDCYLIDFEG